MKGIVPICHLCQFWHKRRGGTRTFFPLVEMISILTTAAGTGRSLAKARKATFRAARSSRDSPSREWYPRVVPMINFDSKDAKLEQRKGPVRGTFLQ